MTSVELTKEHILNVKNKLAIVIGILESRGISHDNSKLEDPEVSIFDIYTDKLKLCTYGSEEYYRYLKSMKPALDHHYAKNAHHPEHYLDGISGMTLIDIVEMFCDWVAATERHSDGNIYKSIDLNKDRFNIPEELCSIFKNTAREVFGKELI